MTLPQKTDDEQFIDGQVDGLQRAYKIVFNVQQRYTGIRQAYDTCQDLLLKIDQDINTIIKGQPEKKIILI